MKRSAAFLWLASGLASFTGVSCASRYSIERALISSASQPCPDAEAVDTGKKDCDGLPIYQLWCGGKRTGIPQAIWCHRGDCFVEQMAGRCWK